MYVYQHGWHCNDIDKEEETLWLSYEKRNNLATITTIMKASYSFEVGEDFMLMGALLWSSIHIYSYKQFTNLYSIPLINRSNE